MTGRQRDAHEAEICARPRPLTELQALTDHALIGGYPPPDNTQLREPRRLARRWGWSRRRVVALLAAQAARREVAHG